MALAPSRQRTLLKVLFLCTGTLILASCGERAAESDSSEALDSFTLMSTVPEAESWLGNEDSFGSVESIALLDNSEVVVADGMNNRLLLFSGGSEVDSFGRRGEGPAEFAMLRVVARGQADTIVALDVSRAKLVVLQARGTSLSQLSSAILSFPAEHLCMLGPRLFVLGFHDSSLVHEISLAGEVLNSFGSPEGADPIEMAISSTGRLACSPDNDRIALVSKMFGIIRIFEATGELIRRDSVPDFSRTIYNIGPGGMRPELPDIGYAHTVDAVHWFGGDLLVQLSRGPRQDGHTRESRWLSDTDGWRAGPADWPRILGYTTTGLVYASVDDPYPVIRIYRWR